MFARRALLQLRLPGPSSRPFATTSAQLSGHNKWSKIKQRKGVNDAQKSVVYGRANREILLAVRNGGSTDPERNIALSNAVKKARADGVPKANIESALAKASGQGKNGGDQLATYEALAHGSVGVIIECMTDNGNRTIHKLREILKQNSASFATVGFMFQRKGVVHVSLSASDGEDDASLQTRLEGIVDAALEAGADDFDQWATPEEGTHAEFYCAPGGLAKLTAVVTSPELRAELVTSELVYVPSDASGAEAGSEELEEKVGELVSLLDDNEDTLRVWTTLDPPSSNPLGS